MRQTMIDKCRNNQSSIVNLYVIMQNKKINVLFANRSVNHSYINLHIEKTDKYEIWLSTACECSKQ